MLIKILVADDSAADRMIIENMLSKHYTLLTACDGEEAVRVLEENDGINLLILDLNMPNMDGFQVLEFVKKNERYAKLRTIILTNYNELDNEIKGLQLGAVDYIRKPIHMASLRARIEVHIALLRAEDALQKQLDEQSLTFDMLFKQAPIGIAISYGCDPKQSDSIVRINPMYEQITGRTKEALINLGWAGITHPDDVEEEIDSFKKLQSGEIKNYSLETRFIKPDGSVVWVHKTVSALAPIGENKVNHICLIQDISERKQIEIERRYITEHDRWTGLYNHEYLASLLQNHAKAKKKSKKALIGINLSMVQLLSANYRYQYSRNLIKKAAEALGQYCADNCILFYPSENNFVYYLFDYASTKELADFGGAIAKTLEELFVTDRIGGGIGILEIEPDQNEADVDLLMRKLMIVTEKSTGPFGKDFQIRFYNEELENMVIREREIVEALSFIAANDSDKYAGYELFLQYQPIMNIKTGSICSFEALARLRTEKLGLVSPLEFIPLAEKTKLIIPIGEKVFAGALRFLNRLKKCGYDKIGVSVNVSVTQLLSPNFVGRIFELIRDMQVEPDNVCIEITESVFASDFDNINNVIEKLRNAGIHVAIDDFGTGYSSLAREKELKVDCMKIDKYFIDSLLHTDIRKTITGDIISIAHRLGHYTIAEGVERSVQLQYLTEHNCDKIQGYFISKPLDEAVALEFLKVPAREFLPNT